jgi:nitroimidazol reductase NimA-like FMN-containing flavoprotein (pyridoxamine 5'-phosphate oxidase superfamily)
MARHLTETETLRLVSGSTAGHLGCVVNGEPYVVPINYIFEEGALYSHSLPGMKIDAMRASPRVCLQVETVETEFDWHSALVFGDFDEIRVPAERVRILRKLLTRFPFLTPVESLMAQDANAPDSIVYRIIIDRMTGVAEEPFGKVQDENNYRPEYVELLSSGVQ